jgi:LmbE family N-acetylglucosaminyl deacetylase
VDDASADREAFAGRTILVVLAHPDDESIACGGTLARLSDAGARIILFCATRGERGGPTGPVRDDILAQTRENELVRAASTLGIAEVILMNHPDGELRWEDVPLFHAEIVAAIRRYAPSCVITFGDEGLYWHGDHIGVYERVRTALGSLGDQAPLVYGVTMPRGMISRITEAAVAGGWTAPQKGFWSLNPNAFGLHAKPPTIVVNVRPWVARKLVAMRSHESQIGQGGHPLDWIDAAHADEWLGLEYLHRLAAQPMTGRVLEPLDSAQRPGSTVAT